MAKKTTKKLWETKRGSVVHTERFKSGSTAETWCGLFVGNTGDKSVKESDRKPCKNCERAIKKWGGEH